MQRNRRATIAVRANMAMLATLTAAAKNNQRGRALVHVRGPHMGRHCRNFEAEAGEQKHEAENQAVPAAAAECAMPAKLTVPVKP